jgi:hypothetical protein
MKGAFYTKIDWRLTFPSPSTNILMSQVNFNCNIVERINIGDMQQKVTLWDPQGKLLLELF